MKINNISLGVAGELRVMSELLLRGYNPAKSYLDNGIDIILENGKKIQVKTSTNQFLNKYDNGRSYHFSLQKGNQKKKVNLSKYTDFLIGFIIPENTFFIIPAKVLDGISYLRFTISAEQKFIKSKYSKYLNNWKTLKGRR